MKPGDAASIGFHVRHIGGATDRLLTYAKGESLSAEQFAALKGESATGAALEDVVAQTIALLDRALDQVAATPPDRPVVVVTNDQAVRRDVATAGANVIASESFVAAAR